MNMTTVFFPASVATIGKGVAGFVVAALPHDVAGHFVERHGGDAPSADITDQHEFALDEQRAPHIPQLGRLPAKSCW